MKRRTFDVIASTIGLGLAALLIVAGGLLTWAHSFAHDQVHDQLAAQQIYFPDKGSEAISSLPATSDQTAISKYAGQQLTTGAQAKAYADHFIAVHLSEMPYKGIYAKVSEASRANPNNADLAAEVNTVFKGTTLRSMLLSAYAWDETATLAGDAALVAWIGAGVFALLGGLGFFHAYRVPRDKELLDGSHEALTPASS